MLIDLTNDKKVVIHERIVTADEQPAFPDAPPTFTLVQEPVEGETVLIPASDGSLSVTVVPSFTPGQTVVRFDAVSGGNVLTENHIITVTAVPGSIVRTSTETLPR